MSKFPVVSAYTCIIHASFLLTLKDTARRYITQPQKIDLPLYTQCVRTTVETQLRSDIGEPVRKNSVKRKKYARGTRIVANCY